MHKEKDPLKIHFPLKSNQDIFMVMEEADAKYVQKIMEKGDATLLKVLDASQYLDVEEMKKRLIVGITLRMISHSVE